MVNVLLKYFVPYTLFPAKWFGPKRVAPAPEKFAGLEEIGPEAIEPLPRLDTLPLYALVV